MRSLNRPDDRAAILSRLRRVHASSPRRWGKMSPHQAVCHLADAFRMATGERPVRPIGTLLHRTVVKWLAFHLPLEWPKDYRTMPEADQEIGGTPPVEFQRDVQALEGLIERFTAPRDGEWPPHPIFGRLSHREWMRWGYLHMDHHLRQFGA